MSTLVECLKRLYNSGKIDEECLKIRLQKGTITQEEYDYIIPPKVEPTPIVDEEPINEEEPKTEDGE